MSDDDDGEDECTSRLIWDSEPLAVVVFVARRVERWKNEIVGLTHDQQAQGQRAF